MITDNERQFLDMVSDTVTKIDNMALFANINTSGWLKFSTSDGRYYRIRIERITQTEFER